MKASELNDNLPDPSDMMQQDKLEFDVVIKVGEEQKEYEIEAVSYDYAKRQVIIEAPFEKDV